MRKTPSYLALTVATSLAAAWVPIQSAGASSPRPQLLGGAVENLASASASVGMQNIAASPNYAPTCWARGRNSPKCINLVVDAIEQARSHEHMKKHRLILPINFRRLSVARQTFVITNLERVDRGIRPYTGLTPSLNHVSRVAAALKLDPSPALAILHTLGIGTWGSIWAEDVGPLASDYDWMYNDGYSPSGGLNLACAWKGAPGCWGHRKNILYPFKGFPTLLAGAGTSKPAGASIAELLTGGFCRNPKYVYTWKRALAHGADGHRIAARFRH